jgi:hypothetical protein
MSAGMGRVLKAGRVATHGTVVPWEPRPPVEEGPPAEVEVVRDRGVVKGIVVRCRCGRVHELELDAPPAAS